MVASLIDTIANTQLLQIIPMAMLGLQEGANLIQRMPRSVRGVA